jgi:hypothetical protein
MRKHLYNSLALLSAISLLLITCKKAPEYEAKENSLPTRSIELASKFKKAKQINVGTIAELYAAVNDPSNAGSLVELAAGIYSLSASYPNGGRLELQSDMSLQGQPGHADYVVIDGSLLPLASFGVVPFRTGSVRMGRGANSLEWLTVKGNVNALSAIETDLPSTETHIRIAHVVVSGSQIGIDIRNRVADQNNRNIDAEIEDNDILSNSAGFGTGIALQNANGVTGATINAALRENYIHHNRVGVRAFNNAATSTVNNCKISITSKSDRIEDNGLGMYISGGLSQVANALANNNSVEMKFHGSSIRNNNPVPMPDNIKPVESTIPIGGMFASGGNSSGNDNKVFNNTLLLDFQACHISDNGTDIFAFGAWSRPPVLLPGTHNSLDLVLQGVSKKATVVAMPSVPAEPAGTNTITINK